MTARGGTRRLTFGETLLATSVFGEQIDVGAVLLHRRKWWPLQPRRIVMAPRGAIWFHPDSEDWREDFTGEPLGLRAFLVHEMTHVWQHQRGINVILRRPPWARYTYLPLEPGKPFERYGIEQQAEIVRHAYLLREGASVAGAAPLEAYAALLPFGAWFSPSPSRR